MFDAHAGCVSNAISRLGAVPTLRLAAFPPVLRFHHQG